jgi:uncharacterized damage-inducible protein DinB
MRNVVRPFVMVGILLAVFVSTAEAQTATIQGDLLKDWTGMKDMMTKIASAMPEDKFSFKPTPAQRNYGEHVLHIAQINMMLMQPLGAKTPAPQINLQAKTKADMIKAMSDTFDYGIAAIKEFDNTAIQATVDAPFMGPSTRARLLFFLLGHTWDTYGQMAVYLRLNGIVPPASQKP